MTFLAGCDAIPAEYEKDWVQLQKEWRSLISVLTGGKVAPPVETPAPVPSASAVLATKSAKANAEILHEVYQVVFMREPEDKSEFGSLVDSLNQGASIEGLYNGFTHSSDYRKLEASNQGATPQALRLFGEELASLEMELPAPVEFTDAATQPLALPVQPGVEPVAAVTSRQSAKAIADGVTVIEYGKSDPQPTPRVSAQTGPATLEQLTDRYTKQFVGASIFTLKRIMGDEALRVMAVKKDYPEKLAQWYSKWVARMARRNVDFGLAQRNKPDESFHYNWAMAATEDRLKWEVLNRAHRVLNEANKR